MFGNNVCALTGNLSRDPELRYFESGNMKAEFAIAVSTGRDKPSDWFDIVVWGKSAERAAKLLRKGSRAVVVGSLKQERWQDRESGANRSKVVLNAQSVEAIAKPQTAQPEAQSAAAALPNQHGQATAPDYGDIPF